MKAVGFLAAVLAIHQSCSLSHPATRQLPRMNTAVDSCRFPHIHSDIVAILEYPCSEEGSYETATALIVHPETLEIVWRATDDITDGEMTPVSTQLLVDLAYASDYVLYPQSHVLKSPLMQALIEMGETDDSKIVAATLLALNRLESAIRRTTGYAAGRAPLLKNMVYQLDDKRMACILMALLLPSGLNLRNLLWHGFCASSLPRRWLSLVLILIHNLEWKQGDDTLSETITSDDERSAMKMLKDPSILALLESKRNDEESIAIMKRWLPHSHRGLLELAFAWKYIRPACCIALLSIILEHGLRLDWCRLNDSPENVTAQPGAYCVTLDGHGQKHQHDLILYPFIGDDNRKNKLVSHLGGATMALLTDLFASSCGGPNLRAALAHGLWDAQLERELVADASYVDTHDELLDMANLVMIAMEGAALCPRPALRQYRPLYSYRAVTLRNAVCVANELQRLVSLRASMAISATSMIHNEHIATLAVPGFDSVTSRVLSALRTSTGEWKAEDVFEEHEINLRLATFGASRSLLEDLVVATSSFACTLEDSHTELQSEEGMPDRRRLKRFQRVCSVTDIAIAMYQFAALVAVLSLGDALQIDTRTEDRGIGATETKLPPETVLKAVERSRMCISTFSNFLTSNTDRALKAAVDYTKGKAIKAVVEYNQRLLKVTKEGNY